MGCVLGPVFTLNVNLQNPTKAHVTVRGITFLNFKLVVLSVSGRPDAYRGTNVAITGFLGETSSNVAAKITNKGYSGGSGSRRQQELGFSLIPKQDGIIQFKYMMASLVYR